MGLIQPLPNEFQSFLALCQLRIESYSPCRSAVSNLNFSKNKNKTKLFSYNQLVTHPMENTQLL